MARLRFDNQTGTLGATLTAGGLMATLASPWAAATVSGADYVALELEPPTAGVRSANYEVVYATPVSGSASVAIIARGQEGTAAVQHNAGLIWSHGPTSQDFIAAAFVNPMTTAGDLILGATAGAAIRLAKGADNQVLTIDPTTHLPLWATPAVVSVAGKTGVVTLVEGDIANLTADLAGKLSLSTATTKGDLVVATASATLARLGVGSDGQVLTADSVQATGVKWATPSTTVTFPLTSAGDETFQPNGIASNTLTLHNSVSAVNGVTITGSATGTPPTIAPSGGDTNLGLLLQGKGSGILVFSSGGTNFNYDGTKLLVNSISGSGTVKSGSGGELHLQAQTSGGGGAIRLQDGSGVDIFVANPGAGTNVNYLNVTGSATGAAVAILSAGTDTNIDLQFTPKGAGVVDLHYASVALGGGAAPSLGTIGGSGPATAAQNCWVAVKINGTTTYLPGWR